MTRPRFVGRFEWERAIRDIPMQPTTKLICLLAATYASKDGTNVRPGIAQLAAAAGVSARTVKRSLDEARTIGVLHRVNRGSNSGRAHLTDVYRLSLPKELGVSPVTS